MSIGILRLYDSVDLSLVSNNQLIYSEVMEYNKDTVDKIFTNLQPHSVSTLNVIVKPVNSVELNSNIIPLSSLKKDGKSKVVVSKQDMYTINTLASSLGVDNINLFSSLDYYKTLSSERIVVVDDFVNGMAGIAVVESGEVLDFISTRPQSLEANLQRMLNRYKTNKVVNATTAKSMSLDLSLNLINYNDLDSDKKSFLSSSLFCLVSEPSMVFKTNDMTFDNMEVPKEGLTKKIIKESKVQEQIDLAVEEPKVGFFKRLFSRNSKEQDVEFVEEAETKAPLLNTAATICLILVSLLLGSQISFATEIPKQLDKFSMKYVELQSNEANVALQDSFMDQSLTFLRSGSPYHLNVSELAESIDVNGRLLSVKFSKDKFEVIYGLKSDKDIDKFSKAAQEKFNVLDSKNYGTVTIGKEKFVKVSVLCN